MANMTINAIDFDASTDFKYTKPRVGKSGNKSVGIVSVQSNKTLHLNTPLMLTWGVNEFRDEQTGKCTYDMSLQFPKTDYETPQTTKFLEVLNDFQQKIKDDAVQYSRDWFGKPKMSPEVVDALFHPMLKYSKDPNTGEPDMTKAPTLRIKLDYWDDVFNCEIYDTESKLVFPSADQSSDVSPMDFIPKGIDVATMIRCGGIWFANGKFGVTWKLVQAKVKPRENFKGKCFIQLSDEDVDRMNKSTASVDDDKNNDVEVPLQMAEDSDDENRAEATEEVVAPDPVESPKKKAAPVKKKVVRKKASST